MKCYDQSINEVYQRANEYYTARKTKRKKIILSALPILSMLLILTVCLIVFIPLMNNQGVTPPTDTVSQSDERKSNRDDTDVTESSSRNLNTKKVDGGINGNLEPDIYPSAWKKMNAVIVKWGKQTDDTWIESFGIFDDTKNSEEKADYSYEVKYVAIEVEFVAVFRETMTESLIPNVEKNIEQCSSILIPEYCLSNINEGQESLVFLNSICRKGVTNNSGELLEIKEYLGVRAGNYLEKDTFAAAPIFSITQDGRVVVPPKAYDTNEKTNEYQMGIMNCLTEANNRIIKNNMSSIEIFKDKISVPALKVYFAYICNLK